MALGGGQETVTTPSLDDALPPGTTIGRYAVRGRLGSGAFGSVYRARGIDDGLDYALKILHASRRRFRKRLQRERQLQARLHHVNVVRVLREEVYLQHPVIVMELVDGPNLHQLLCRSRLSQVEIDKLVRGMVSGVRAAHDERIIHRDLKPENILLAGPDRVPKISDFGLAKAIRGLEEGTLTRTGSTMGTCNYMAPEQANDAKSVDARADVFSLGCILYEMLTGKVAFPGTELLTVLRNIERGEYVPVASHRPRCPERMARTVALCLEVEAHRRIPSCQILLDVWDGGSWSPERGVTPVPAARPDPFARQASAMTLPTVRRSRRIDVEEAMTERVRIKAPDSLPDTDVLSRRSVGAAFGNTYDELASGEGGPDPGEGDPTVLLGTSATRSTVPMPAPREARPRPRPRAPAPERWWVHVGRNGAKAVIVALLGAEVLSCLGGVAWLGVRANPTIDAADASVKPEPIPAPEVLPEAPGLADTALPTIGGLPSPLPPPPATTYARVDVSGRSHAVVLDGVEEGPTPWSGQVTIGRPHELVLRDAEGRVVHQQSWSPDAGQNGLCLVPGSWQLCPLPGDATLTLTVRTAGWGHVEIDGNRIPPTAPLRHWRVRPGRHEIEIINEAHQSVQSFVHEFSPNEAYERAVDFVP